MLACAGTLWLAHRFSLLMSLPIETSVKSLSIPIPKVPLLSVDKVTDTSIAFHWSDVSGNTENGDSKKEKDDLVSSSNIDHYILYINGIQTLRIKGDVNKCTLEELEPSSNYQIDLVAFNLAGFRSKSSPIFIKTSAKHIEDSKLQSLQNIDNVIKYLLREQERESLTRTDPFKSTTASSASNGRSRSGTLDGNQQPPTTSTSTNPTIDSKHPHLIDDINELKWILESGLEEVQQLMRSYKEAEFEFQEEESNLIATRDEARTRRKFEDNNRTNLRQEIKLLEEQRVRGASRVSADQKKIKERERKIDELKHQIEKLNSDTIRMQKELEFQTKQNPKKLLKLENEVMNLNKEIFVSQEELHNLEDELRYEISLRKTLESTKLKVIELFEKINENIDEVTGLLRPEGVQYLNDLFKLKPEWEKELYQEIKEIDEKAESDYRHLQAREWEKFELKKKQIDEEKRQRILQNVQNVQNVNSNPILPTVNINTSNENVTTGSTPTNVNGYLYNQLPSHSNGSAFNSQQFNSNSMRSLMGLRSENNGSFQGEFDDSASLNAFNGKNNIWAINNSDRQSVNMLLPQNLIDSEEIDQLLTNTNKSNNHTVLSPHINPLSQPSLNPQNGSAASPNISQINQFDYYQNNGLNGMVLGSSPHHQRITSLSALTTAASQMNLMNSPPQSLHAQLSNNDSIVTTQSPFNNNNSMNMQLNTNPVSGGNDIDPVSMYLTSNGLSDNTSSHHYSKIFGTLGSDLQETNINNANSNSNNYNLNSNSTSTNVNTTIKNNNNNNSSTRGRSSSFGSSIWSNGNTNNNHANSGSWGGLQPNNGFSFLGTPASLNQSEQQSLVSTMNDQIGQSPSTSIVEQSNTNKVVNTTTGDHHHPNSPSFLKSMMGKFGASPTKTLSNKTVEHHFDAHGHISLFDETIEENPKDEKSPITHNKSSSFGSSRFFKLPRKNSMHSTSQASAATLGSTDGSIIGSSISEDPNAVNGNGGSGSGSGSGSGGGGFMGRKLSFAFKRDKDKE